jgi:hypothetical protein
MVIMPRRAQADCGQRVGGDSYVHNEACRATSGHPSASLFRPREGLCDPEKHCGRATTQALISEYRLSGYQSWSSLESTLPRGTPVFNSLGAQIQAR